ncbi:hypothetical protein [Microbacterium gorillae]|uniref:hypothetical protein n=1 Tax=Microbacterium gorillae TaxID=1231063 RepID=UPI003D95B6B9
MDDAAELDVREARGPGGGGSRALGAEGAAEPDVRETRASEKQLGRPMVRGRLVAARGGAMLVGR